MMKKMMVALAALTLVGVANAATMIWHWAPNGSADEVEASTTFNMVVSDVRLSVAQAVLAVNPDYDTSELTGDTSTPQGTVTVIGDDHLISLTDGESPITVTYSTAWGSPEIDFGTDGKYCHLVLFSEQDGTFAVVSGDRVTADMVDDTGSNLPEATLGSDDMDWIGGTYTDVMPTNIPEPTALVLLALGVAGVALRRRVA